MTIRDWAHIKTGSTFEALVQTLLLFDDPLARTFGRPGKDGGQDARSGDDRRVYQAKYHAEPRWSTLLRDAKREAEKIAQYRKPGHARAPQWKAVRQWCLVTNGDFNPTDDQRWQAEIVPLFRALDLDAVYWSRNHLDALLTKHPEVERAFFGHRTRAFLSLPEALDQRPGIGEFTIRDYLRVFTAREAELQTVRDFVRSDRLFLMVNGPGGVGKTQFMIEAALRAAAEGLWTIYWANVTTMKNHGEWYCGLVPGRPTLLLVDEPDDVALLKILIEQTLAIRGSDWKILVSVRSAKSPVVAYLTGRSLMARVQSLALPALPSAEATELCEKLLTLHGVGCGDADWQRKTARRLFDRFGGYPFWLTLAAHLLMSDGDLSNLPEHALPLMAIYLDEVLAGFGAERSRSARLVLRWIALFRTVNRDSTEVIERIAANAELRSAADVLEITKALVERGALVTRGVGGRLVELKPDLMRDYLLRDWLTRDVGYGESALRLSKDAERLVQQVMESGLVDAPSGADLAVLEGLVIAEFTLRVAGTRWMCWGNF
jgi:hypothetical protein